MTHPSDKDRPGSDDISLDRVLSALLRRPLLVLGVPLFLATAGLSYVTLFGSYMSQSSFTPEESGLGLGSLSGLAAQLGVSVPGGLDGQSRSLDFYVRVLQSPAVLTELAATQYTFPRRKDGSDTVSGTLFQLYGINGDNEAERTWTMVKTLEPRISVSVDRIARIVTIRTKAPWPALSQQINRRMLDLLEDLNTRQRQSQAATQRAFVQERLGQALADLTSAETDHQEFLERNRMYDASPKLTFEANRLQRRIELRQQVYVTLAQAYEQAAIEEVRDTPVLTVLEHPELFYKRSRNPLVVAAVALAFGLAISCTMALGLEYASQASANGARWARHLSRLLRLNEEGTNAA
jgi:uncharacterized protein involved in exopolysaccharide biosynthesis